MPTQIDFHSLTRPARVIVTEEFTDDERPEVKTKVSLRYLNVVEQLRGSEKAEEMIAKYIENKEEYPHIGGEPADLTASLIRIACSIEAMQPPKVEDGVDRLTAHEIIVIAHSAPSIYLDIQNFARKVNAGYDPKASAEGATAPSSASA